MVSQYERAVIASVLPGLFSLADELRRDLIVETPKDTGDMKEDVYASVDDVTGEIEVGYDETGRNKPHAYFVVLGTSRQEANPSIQRVVYKKRRQR